MVPSNKTCILVIGGGPAGSYAATTLAREGLDVVLLEATKFPRYHIGEGMLPSMRHYLKYIDCEEIFDKHGFMHKPGACFKLREDLRESFTDFNALGPNFTTWNVIRSEADELLLNHAAAQGVHVYQETRVDSISFTGDPANSRPVEAAWTNKSGNSGSIEFDWLIDASGRSGIMSTKYLKNREFREHLRNVAVWGYWRNVTIYQEGTARSNAPWFEAMTDGLGWAWLIPLHDGTTSIGVVMHQDISNKKKKEYPGGPPSLKDHYLHELSRLPGVLKLIAEKGCLVEGSVRGSTDYSYSAPRYSGDHFRIIGDAANFVDPFFASGVHIAMTGALAAAITICASMKGQAEEIDAQHWHDAKVGISHTRFLFVVLGAYRQMRQQEQPVLHDVNEDNFDAAFSLFRPVIAGISDASEKLNDEQIGKVMDFCANIFDPSVGVDNLIAVRKRYNPAYSSLTGPILSVEDVEKIAPGDPEAHKVFLKINSLKVIREEADYSALEKEGMYGYVANTVRGQLGFCRYEK
ncbi:FAD/NAD-binding domain-containing protein [Mycena albidolilacea]|uniref:FAD/NAD-binding domain-containing protein n=1 Tax=Mycena albidolilacea TaxID=1033008 RepID=A0AAD7EGN1_9AGAR|nr:FAD/NAD-binding domain-containing protein [Mycena albidolilacea]